MGKDGLSYLLTAVGFMAGGFLGGLLGIATAEANRAGDLSDIGLGLIGALGGVLLGAVGGVFALLAVLKHRAAVATALLVFPVGLLAAVLLVMMAAALGSGGGSSGGGGTWVGQAVALALVVLIPIAARFLALAITGEKPRS